MKYYGEINPHKFDGDWHPSPPLEDDFIDGNFHNHNDHYRDYMLTSLVKAEIVKTLKLELSRYNCKKTVHLTKDDRVEIVYLDHLQLRYKFGRIKDLDTNRLCLDCSDECTSEIIHVSLQDIRDIEVYYGKFILRPGKCELNDAYKNDCYCKHDEPKRCDILYVPEKMYTQDDIEILLQWLNGD